MNARSTLKRSDYEDYLVYLYFGAEPDDYLLRCINRAHLDFSRTLWDLRKLLASEQRKELLYRQATSKLEQRFSGLRSNPASVIDEEAFDTWHRDTCQQLRDIYDEYGYNEPDHHLFVGQAQKWINMTFKYLFALGELGKYPHSGFGEVYPFCHAPLDTVLIDRLGSKEYGIPWPRSASFELRRLARAKRQVIAPFVQRCAIFRTARG